MEWPVIWAQLKKFPKLDANGKVPAANLPSGTEVDAAEYTTYDNTASGLTGANVQDAIDEIAEDVADNTSELTTQSQQIEQLDTTKLAKNQGIANAGKTMKVGSDGVLTPVADSVFELIETITITEDDVATIVREYEPGGAAYSFKAMRIRRDYAAGNETVSTPFQISCAIGGTFSSIAISPFGKVADVFIVRIGNHWLNIGTSGNFTTGLNALNSPLGIMQIGERITRIAIQLNSGNTPFPVGTEFKIYGIRV